MPHRGSAEQVADGVERAVHVGRLQAQDMGYQGPAFQLNQPLVRTAHAATAPTGQNDGSQVL